MESDFYLEKSIVYDIIAGSMIAPALDNGEVPPPEEVLIALRRIMRAIDLHSRELSQRCGLTGPQLIILAALHPSDSECPTIGRLARSIHLSQATVTGILTRLEARGLVQRKRSGDDRRQVFVSLTDSGRETLGRAPSPLQDRFIAAFSRLHAWEKHHLLAALHRIVEMMEAADLDAAPLLETGAIDPSSPLDARDHLRCVTDHACLPGEP